MTASAIGIGQRTRSIRVESVPCRDHLRRLARGERVAFIKRTHGVWDHLTLLVTGELERDGFRRCDQMIFKRRLGNELEAHAARQDYLRYLGELAGDVTDPLPGTATTVSLALDYITRRTLHRVIDMPVRTDPRLQDYWSSEYSYAELFDCLDLWDRSWEYAQMPTVGVLTGELLALPEIARRFHLVVYGPAKLRDLGSRWGVDPRHFTFHPAPAWPEERPRGTIFTDPVLPPLSTFGTRFEILETLLSVRSTRPRLFLFEAGTVSQWLIARLALEAPKDSFLDLGRALELWFPDRPWPLKSRLDAHFRRAAQRFYGRSRYLELRAQLRVAA